MRYVFLGPQALAVHDASKPLLDDYAVLVAVYYSCLYSLADFEAVDMAKKADFLENVPRKVRQAINTVSRAKTAAVDAKSRSYSCSGQVIAVGKQVRSLKAGDFVACIRTDVTFYTDIVCVAEYQTVRVARFEHVRLASLIGPGALALQAVRESKVQIGDRVCINGLDLVGHLMIQLFKHAGCQVYGIHSENRFDVVDNGCSSADYVYPGWNHATESALLLQTQNHGVDVMVFSAPSHYEIAAAELSKITRTEGTMLFVGWEKSCVLPSVVSHKRIRCIFVSSLHQDEHRPKTEYPYHHVRWTEQRNMQLFLQLLEKDALSLEHLVGPDNAVTELAHDYDATCVTRYPGVVVKHQHHEFFSKEQSLKIVPEPGQSRKIFFMPSRDRIRVGVIGIGNFAKNRLLPILASNNKVKITALVDATVTNSLNVAQLYDVEHVLVSDTQLFVDDMIDVVFIASPHKYHCDQAMKALKYGKAVFLEKPMVTDMEQLLHLTSYAKNHYEVPLCVDYSRSYAPFSRKIKHELDRRTTPVVIQYRVNAGFVPKEHWMQTEIGAGRIIGEACHIIDLFLYLVDSQPVSVSVEAIHSVSDVIFPTDNFTATISFEDGSLCSLLYTALGHDNVGRERMELFFDAKTIVMDDYEYLAGFGMTKLFDETAMVPDRGYKSLVTNFLDFLTTNTAQPFQSIDRLHQVASLTFLIDKLACEGGGTLLMQDHQPKHHSANLQSVENVYKNIS